MMPDARFRKGQAVSFRMGMRQVHGTVKEDRGLIGVNGRRLYAVEFATEFGSSRIELPADQLKLLPRAVRA
jgi:hypothetical protein